MRAALLWSAGGALVGAGAGYVVGGLLAGPQTDAGLTSAVYGLAGAGAFGVLGAVVGAMVAAARR